MIQSHANLQKNADYDCMKGHFYWKFIYQEIKLRWR